MEQDSIRKLWWVQHPAELIKGLCDGKYDVRLLSCSVPSVTAIKPVLCARCLTLALGGHARQAGFPPCRCSSSTRRCSCWMHLCGRNCAYAHRCMVEVSAALTICEAALTRHDDDYTDSCPLVIAPPWPAAGETLSPSRKEDVKCWNALLSRISKDVKAIGGAFSIPAMQLASVADMTAKRNELAR